MLGRVFRYQGGLWRALNTLTDIMALSVLWLLCSLPVLTLGAATTALYDSVVRCIRYKQPKPYARFFRTLKNVGRRRSIRSLDADAAAAVQRRVALRRGGGRGVLCRAGAAARCGVLGVSDPLAL